MAATTQVAVRLTDELLEELDWLVVRCDFDNRADVIRAALAELAKRERGRQIDEQIIEAYTRMPQADDEIARVGSRGFPGLDDDDDWEDWF